MQIEIVLLFLFFSLSSLNGNLCAYLFRQEKALQTRRRLLFHGFIRLWRKTRGFASQTVPPRAAHFISWNDAIVSDGLPHAFSMPHNFAHKNIDFFAYIILV